MDKRDDPYGAFNFRIEIDGVTLAAFSEASGLSVTVDVIEYRTGNDKLDTVRKLSGLRKYSNIILKRGLTKNGELWGWLKSADRRNGAIVLLDGSDNEVMRWHFTNAFPCKWTGPTLAAGESTVAFEEFELAIEGIEFAS